jgi:threonyl-tRNA synthetase
MFVVGKREAQEKAVTIRRLGQEKQETMPLADAIATLKKEATPPDLR